MKSHFYLYVLIITVLVLTSCISISSGSIVTPVLTMTQPPSLTSILPISTLTPHPTQIQTLTLSATLDPKQAQEAIKALLQRPSGCEAPCFGGIVPNQTTLGEAKNIFFHLGLHLEPTTSEGVKAFYGVSYEFDDGLRVTPVLTIQENIVRNFSIGIVPELEKTGVPREWLAYSPEMLIKQYGPPSNVSFFLGRGPVTSFTMDMYFDAVDLIVEYFISDLHAKLNVCPLRDQFDSIHVWMGKNPLYPPASGVSLKDATSLTIEELSKLMTGDPKKACFNLDAKSFP